MSAPFLDPHRVTALLEHNRTVGLLIDPSSGAIIDANRAAQRFYGYTREQLQAMNIAEINTLSQVEVRAEMDLAEHELRDYFIFKHRLANGEIRDVEVWSGPVENDSRVLLYSIVHDISDRKRQEIELARRERMFRAIFEQAGSGVAVVDSASGRLMRVNQKFCDILGYTQQELTAMTLSDITHPEDLRAHQYLHEALLASNSEQDCFEERYIHKRGNTIWVNASMSAMWTAGNRNRQHVLVIQDITAAKAMTAALMRSENALKQSEQRWELAISGANDGIWDWNVVEGTVFLSSRCYALLRLPVNTRTVRFQRLLSLVHPEDMAQIQQHIRAHFEHQSELFEARARILRSDKSYVWIKFRGKALFGEHDKPVRMCGWMTDITQEMQIERMKSDFLSTAAHELRTPMTSIYGFSELLLHNDFDPGTQQELLQNIYSQAGLIRNIVDELLDLSRIESRQALDFDFEPLPLYPLILDAIREFAVPAGRAAAVVQEAPAALAQVLGDRNKLRQAIANILSNAYKYSPDGGDITISWPCSDGRFGISVRDQGIGMHADDMANVTQRFFRADKSGKIPGTGLGMSIVEEIIRLHRGNIEIESNPGLGTTVTLWLPQHIAA